MQLLPNTTLSNVQAAIDRAVANQSWLILCAHGVTSGTATGSQITVSLLTSIADYLASSSIAVHPVGDVWRANV